MDIIKKNKWLFIIGFIILGLVFYRYDWVPSQARKDCMKIVEEKVAKDKAEYSTSDDSFYINTYNVCLAKKGFKSFY